MIKNESNKSENREDGAVSSISAPSISLPKGGGAIRGIGEKFAANPVTGTGSFSIPIAATPGRSGFSPQLSLSYDSGSGNGPFGFGWSLSIPSITRKTDKGIPKYEYADESDVYILSGAEDLVPILESKNGEWKRETFRRTVDETNYTVQRYRPRIEGLFARIERWTNTRTNETHWRSISRDNITTVYGRSADSKIEDPQAPDGFPRVFSWLICESYDDKGNVIYYQYQRENSKQINLSFTHERNRTDKSRSANRYLKRIKYGNKTPVEHDSDLPREFREDLSKRTDWLFEVVLDYEEGHYEELPPDPEGRQFVNAHNLPTQDWQRRQDPFSSYRPGFEVRTYRLCHRVLMFHHFPGELGVDDYLVRSTGFKYKKGPIASFITSVTQSGFKRRADGTYLKKSLPPLEFQYSEAVVRDKVEDVDEESLENLPQGPDGTQYQWADIDGEGLPGILTEQGDSWFYKRNISPLPVIDKDGKPHTAARFAAAEQLATIPSFTNLSGGRQQLLDLAGDGQLDVVEFDSPTPGFFERTKDETWHTFRPFESLPNISWQDPNLKFVDLTGDGHADIFVTEDEAFTWYQSLAEAGFASGEKVRQALDENKGPKLVLADGTQSIYLADISGDGLTDLVRIRSGEVCYWPNLGYGRFGARVTMDNPPHFDTPDQLDHRRIRLADIDGSGVTDIIYLKSDGAYIYLNESGNGWADPEKLKSFPKINNLSSVLVVDLLGTGTACLVWSSPLPGHKRKPMRYIDLMGGEKPHLLIKTVNNLGAETHVRYAPSTKFYLADKQAGKPWVTRISFAVHVVERVETIDRISKNRFVTRYAYHHGFFDGVEREFRGFGMVEQWDSEEFTSLTESGELSEFENIDLSSHVPPVLTKTWFHTGAYFQSDKISLQYLHEYYGAPKKDDANYQQSLQAFEKSLLPDTTLPTGLSAEEAREAARALKGSILRQEIYGLDGTNKANYPYTVSERNYMVKSLQPKLDNKHAVFFVHPKETIDFYYERNPADPRISHQLTLNVDDFGNIERSAIVGYPRLAVPERRPEQAETHITLSVNRFINRNDKENWYRAGLPFESRLCEVVKPPKAIITNDSVTLFTFDEINSLSVDLWPIQQTEPASDKLLPYREWDWRKNESTISRPKLRLIEHNKILYRKNDLTGPLSFGDIDSLALPFESYTLAFTPELLTGLFGSRVTGAMMNSDGKYVHFENDNDWWIPSGRVFYHTDADVNHPANTASDELTEARKHFFLPRKYTDPFKHSSIVDYEHDLLIISTRDALNNRVQAEYDYRVLQPKRKIDPNHNHTIVTFDTLGMVVGTAVQGKIHQDDQAESGDNLDDFEPDLTQSLIDGFYSAADPHVPAPDLLKDATTRIVYDRDRFYKTRQAFPQEPEKWEPVFTAVLSRETHVSDLRTGDKTRIQISFSYSDGFGREIQKKIQAEDGPLVDGGPIVSLRWVGSGWTIFNNKGKPVRQYEPFFSQLQERRHRFEFGVKVGVSPVLFYDPLERVVATLHPNHTYEKVVFDPWRQVTWDGNDTVLQADPKNDIDIGGFFQRIPDSEYLLSWYDSRINGQKGDTEKSAAEKAAHHNDTPTAAHFDSLGRVFLTVADNGQKGTYETRVELDIEGNQHAVIDAKDRVVMQYNYNMVGPEQDENSKPTNTNRLHQASMEAGERRILNDVTGKQVYGWNSRGHRTRTTYDELQRPTGLYVSTNDNPEVLVEKTVYGESLPNPEQFNHRGRIYQVYDGAGVVTSEKYDFKGNLLCGRRELLQEYKEQVDWAQSPPLESEIFTGSTQFDALNRAVQIAAPHSNQGSDNINIIQPAYNEANLLESVHVWLGQSAEPQVLLNPETAQLHAVENIDYDAKGQRTRIEYGNKVFTEYDYDKDTFRLIQLKTTKPTFPNNQNIAQDLQYAYDPVGNITSIRDNAQQAIYFKNQVVEPHTEYRYDAIYRLIEAKGREHPGQQSNPETTWNDRYRTNLDHPHPNDIQKMRHYTEKYEYDEVGNILKLIHQVNNNGDWTRTYNYNEPNLIDSLKTNNRLSTTTVGSSTVQYKHDEHGSMIKMPHLPVMEWDFEDQLHVTQRQVVNNGNTAERTYYVYDAAGERVRKVTERQNGTRKDERIYLGGFEIYRDYNGNGTAIELERETLHIMDDTQRIAMIETKTIDTGNDPSPTELIRFQFSSHLGSASLELDNDGKIISYEEYYPYGSTSYQAVDKNIKSAAKRYRYTGKERDEENGLYYHSARYYACWLGRWTAADPAGVVDGVNLFAYVRGSPVVMSDPSGGQSLTPEQVAQLTGVSKQDIERLQVAQLTGVSLTPTEADRLIEKYEPTAQPQTRPSDWEPGSGPMEFEQETYAEPELERPVPRVRNFNIPERAPGQTWDPLTTERIARLHTEIQTQVREFINKAERWGVRLRITSGYRTEEEQNELYEQGRSRPGKIVTKAQGGKSIHNFGLAIDVVEIKEDRPVWDTDWELIGHIGERSGFEWGGSWTTFPDRPHLQMTFGLSIEDLREGYPLEAP